MLKENIKEHVFVCIAPPRPCMYAPRYVSSIARLACPSSFGVFGGGGGPFVFFPPLQEPHAWGAQSLRLTYMCRYRSR